MFGFVTRRDPVTDDLAVDVPWVVDLVRWCGLVVVIITVSLASPRPGTDGPRGLAIAVTLALSAAAWIVWLLSGNGPWPGIRHWMNLGSLVVMAAAGGVLAGLSPSSPAVAVGCAACFSAGVRLRTELSLAIVAETVATFLVAGLATGAPAGVLLGFPFAFAGLWSVALTRRAYLVRAEQAERTLAETRRAREAEMHAAALAERARIARDIHDVLAHSLAAVSVNLQAAEGLLTAESLPADNPELVKAIECVNRAGTLTREGLAAARRAILALREDAAPLPDQLSSLAAEYRKVGDLAVDFAVTGEPRPLPETGQAGRLPDGAGRTDQRAQARPRPARHRRARLRGRRGHGQRGQPAVAGRRENPARRHRGRGRADRPARARRAGRRRAGGGAGRRDLAGMPEDSGMTENPEPVTVVVADDQSAVREGLVLLLGTVPGIAVTGEAEDGEAAVEIVAAKNPQVVLMDLNMPRCDGVEATRRIRASHPQTQVVVLTTYSDDESIIGALQAGALGYLTKDATRAEIGRAVLAAAAGQAVLDPEVQQRLLSAAVRAPAAPAAAGAADPADTDLTPRESEVLRLIAAGKSNREIARALFVSEATVKTHVNRIFAKTGSRDRTQAMRYAYTHGYAEPQLPVTAAARARRPKACLAVLSTGRPRSVGRPDRGCRRGSRGRGPWLGQELDTLRRPLRVGRGDVGDPDIEERAGVVRVIRRRERHRGLVIGRAAAGVEEEPAVGDLQDDRVAFHHHLRPEHRPVKLAGPVLVRDHQEVSEHEPALRGRGVVIAHVTHPLNSASPLGGDRRGST